MSNKIIKTYQKLEKALSDLRFAVVIITLFLLSLVYGTFMESYHGTEYANRLVYKSWWFIGIQVGMFLSILTAATVRLPLKKRLYGFYTIHSGLIILFIGSLFTYINGIDGSLELKPNSPARRVVINEDKLQLVFSNKESGNKLYEVPLPFTAGKSNLDRTINKVEIKEFLPFSENTIRWVNGKAEESQSSQYLIFNDNVNQEFTLSLSNLSDFESMKKLGPLSIHYMPKSLSNCFNKKTKSGFIIWSLTDNDCFTAEEKGISVEKTDKNTRFIVFKHQDKFLKFFPDFSPIPINDDLTKDENSSFRVFSRDLFQKKPHLFLFGKEVSFYRKRSKKWFTKKFTAENQFIKLPWMSFKVRLLKHSDSSYPVQIPEEVIPVHDNGKIIKGDNKAVRIVINGSDYWIRSDAPLKLSNGREDLFVSLEKKLVTLPYQITLNRFKMNTNPGTKTPASFESFVQLLDTREGSSLTDHHVFMNNPLKYDEFTFYQSSYFKMSSGDYGSVLSVNYDPGRFFKYLGSFMIVFGSIWHYIIRRKKKKTVSNDTKTHIEA